MKARAADTVYWPNLTGDITRTRSACFSCHTIAKSNPAQPPTPPKVPEYPFQALAADYFHYRSHYYAVIVDRYSHWPLVYRAEDTETGSKGLIKHLREIFSTYGVPEEISSDQGTEFTSKETKEFLDKWQVHHRVSSTAFPHSNCRAELGVKQVKRIIMDNTSKFGSLDVDSFHKAIMSYRNTVDPVTRCSPALTVFGRQVRDGLPILPGKYNPHNTWQELLQHREQAMAKRHVLHHEAWSEHTKKLGRLQNGDKVFLQNQVGPNPRKWERTGTVMECKDHDQYTVKVDGTGRVTLRNRKFLRQLKQIPKHSSPSPPPLPSDPTIQSVPAHDSETEATREEVPETASYPVSPMPTVSPHTYPSPEPSPGYYTPQPSPGYYTPQPASPVRSVAGTPTPAPSPTRPTPMVTTVPATPAVTRTQRTKRPNTLFNPETWDLGGLEADSPTLTRRQVAEIFLSIAQNLDKGL